MSLSRIQAIDEIAQVFKTVWDTTAYATRVKWDNVANDIQGPDPWCRVTIKHTSSDQASLSGSLGQRRFRRRGRVVVQLFEQVGAGLSGSTDYAKMIMDAYEGVTTPGGVTFYRAGIQEIGPSGDYFQTNIGADFEYDEIK